MQKVTIYTDGGCLGNPGPGGYGAVLLCGSHRKELCEGYRLTTNNRMELLASIVALETLKESCAVTLHTDSQYVVNGIEKGWAKKWRSNGWMRNRKEKAINPDLWARLLDVCENHDVTFKWVKGHAGNKENERCDQLANGAGSRPNLLEDEHYGNTDLDAMGLV
ncbi:MAG: ribonuclease HI [Planctomycetes bacterium]|nr:ribonuclease HI [Planctomycetota bacterium]